jgi:hypothetical protein
MQLKQTPFGVFQGCWTAFRIITSLPNRELCGASKGWQNSLLASMVSALILYICLALRPDSSFTCSFGVAKRGIYAIRI